MEDFLKRCKESGDEAYSALRSLLERLEDPTTRTEARIFLAGLQKRFSSQEESDRCLHTYHFQIQDIYLDQYQGLQKRRKLTMMVIPSIFVPEDWSFTFYEGINRHPDSIFSDRTVAELGCGNGWISIAIAEKWSPLKVYGLDINPRAVKISWINLYLNALDDNGQPIYDAENKTLLDRVEFYESDLLSYCRDNKIELERIVGCIPQILNPNPEAMSKMITENASEEFLHSLSNYCALQGFVEDQFGLGLIARAVEEGISIIKPQGIMIFNMGGRPGQAVCKRLFERRGLQVNKLWQTKVLQAADTDISALVEIEKNSPHRFEFFMGLSGDQPICARTAWAYANAGGRISHALSVYSCKLRQPNQVKKIFEFLRNGFNDIGSSLDLSFEDDSVADEKIPFLAHLANVLKHLSFPYEPPAGNYRFRGLIAGFMNTYHHIPLTADNIVVFPSRTVAIESALRLLSPHLAIVDEQLSPYLPKPWLTTLNIELMDPLRFLYLKHRGECVVLSIRSDTTWYQIKSQAVLNWVELQNVNFQCLCCVGTYTKICLQSDVHLNSILEMCQHMSVSIISAEVSIVAHKLVSVEENRAIAICRSHSPTGICSSSQSTNSIQSLLNDGIHKEFDGIESRPSFDVCPALDKKNLLSDSWSDIMKGGVGLVFEGGAQGFREHLIKYATKNSFDYIFKKNDKRYIKVICSVQTPKPCGWFIKAKSLPLTSQFQIYEANLVHDCVGHVPPKEARRLSSKLIGSLVVDSIIENPHMGGREVKSAMKNIYGFSIPGWRAWKASEESKEQVWGSYAASYDDLRWYCAAIKTTNPGSVVVLEFDETTSCFQRVFISFKASIDGFKSCRPLLFVDATFLNGRSNGTLLAATAKDGDNGLFPIAIAVVSAENHDNWEWFLAHIRDNIKHDDQIIYISDRNVGLMSAFYSVFDNPVNFFCLFHLLSNLRGKFAGGKFSEIRSKLVRIFTECAYAPTKDLFAVKLSEFREVGGEKAALWLKTLPYEKWAVAYSPHVTRYGEMTSNAIESFNAWIKEARGLPITHMLDTIRQGINKWIVCRRKSSAYWTSALCPSWELQWQLLTDTSASWKVLVCSSNDYEVLSDVSARVDLASRSCSCYQWQVTGFPCAHTLAVIRCVRQSVYTHVHKCFYASTYRDCYQHDIHPIPGTSRYEMSLDSDTTIQPPILKRRAGRPKKSRLPSYGEFSNKKKSKNI